MSVKLRRGKTKFVYLPVTTSTALAVDSLVTFSSGLLTAAASGTAVADLIGVIRHAIASTDSDYATARSVEVEVPVERFTEWECTTASLVAGDILKEVDLTDAVTVNRGASSVKVARATRVISSTIGIFFIKFQGSY